MEDYELTARQAEVLAFIERFQGDKGYPPTRAEIAREFGWRSPNAAEEHVRALARKGRLLVDRHLSRGLRLA